MALAVEMDTRQLSDRLRNLTSRVSRLEPPLRKFGDYLKRETDRQFDSESDPDGNRWAALAPSTLDQKRRLGFPDAILTRTGAMRRSIFYTAQGKSLTFGLEKDYARYHQEGTPKMPQRRIVGMNDKRMDTLTKLIKSHLRK